MGNHADWARRHCSRFGVKYRWLLAFSTGADDFAPSAWLSTYASLIKSRFPPIAMLGSKPSLPRYRAIICAAISCRRVRCQAASSASANLAGALLTSSFDYDRRFTDWPGTMTCRACAGKTVTFGWRSYRTATKSSPSCPCRLTHVGVHSSRLPRDWKLSMAESRIFLIMMGRHD